tara:strand:- start:997 stop:1512 length:516 start_codon:yes stop_codon:yes gene_type:complete
MNIFFAVIYVFLLRLIEQALGTLRSLYVNKGKPKLGALLGFIESAIWVIAISQVIKDLNDPLLIIGYALGFAAGTISGSYIESTIAIGNVVVRVFIERNENSELLANELRANDFGVTVINGQGRDGEVSIAWCVVPRKKVKELLNIVSEITPDAYVTTEPTNPTNINSNNK